MTATADLLVYDSSGALRVLVEVKNTPTVSRVWATEFRRNLQRHGHLPRADYFVLATPEQLYVWKEPAQPDDPPAAIVRARDLWTPYLGSAATPPRTGEAFELAIASWLSDVARNWDVVRPREPEARTLEETGLPDTIRGGRVEHSIAA